MEPPKRIELLTYALRANPAVHGTKRLLRDATGDGPAGDDEARSHRGVRGQTGDTAVISLGDASRAVNRPCRNCLSTCCLPLLTDAGDMLGHAVTGVRLWGRVTRAAPMQPLHAAPYLVVLGPNTLAA